MQNKIDRTQKTVLSLIFNSLRFEDWYMQGKLIGFSLKNDLGKEVRYCLDPLHFNTNRPPSLDWQTFGVTPESQIRQMLHNHFDSIQKLIAKNDWIYPSHSMTHPEGVLLSFSITGTNSHVIVCGERLGDDNAISCYQLLDLYKKEFVRTMLEKVNSYLVARLGEEKYKELFSLPGTERTLHYVRCLHDYID